MAENSEEAQPSYRVAVNWRRQNLAEVLVNLDVEVGSDQSNAGTDASTKSSQSLVEQPRRGTVVQDVEVAAMTLGSLDIRQELSAGGLDCPEWITKRIGLASSDDLAEVSPDLLYRLNTSVRHLNFIRVVQHSAIFEEVESRSSGCLVSLADSPSRATSDDGQRETNEPSPDIPLTKPHHSASDPTGEAMAPSSTSISSSCRLAVFTNFTAQPAQ